jgi:hypothetical protein
MLEPLVVTYVGHKFLVGFLQISYLYLVVESMEQRTKNSCGLSNCMNKAHKFIKKQNTNYNF